MGHSMFYFAYGSNMAPTRMAVLCPRACLLGTASIDGWKFRFSRSGYATIVPWPGARVHGVLWRIGPGDVARLDEYEEVANGLYRRHTVALAGSRKAMAMAYIARDGRPGAPRAAHLREIIAAARRWRFAEAYVQEEIADWKGTRSAMPRLEIKATRPRGGAT